jgi:RHS repeat-associated protein
VYYLTDGMGSVIGLANNAGQSVAKYSYDGFGNIRNSSGNDSAASILGGDFRFQGQWLESESGLYYMRARDYDSNTGRFISRDPVDLIQTEPESFDPYQFVYDNPYIFTDPTGAFTLSELNVSMKIENILNASENFIANQIKDYAVDKAKGVLGDVFGSLLKSWLPGSWIQEGFKITKYEPGLRFERFVQGSICSILGDAFANFTQPIWFEPRVGVSGRPYSDGYNCYNILHQNERGRFGSAPESSAFPDFIFKNGQPTVEPPKGLLVGDIKYSVKGLYEGYVNPKNKENQWQATTNYAKYENRHQYAPITFFAAMTADKKEFKFWLEEIEKRAIEAHVVAFVLTLT